MTTIAALVVIVFIVILIVGGLSGGKEIGDTINKGCSGIIGIAVVIGFCVYAYNQSGGDLSHHAKLLPVLLEISPALLLLGLWVFFPAITEFLEEKFDIDDQYAYIGLVVLTVIVGGIMVFFVG